VRNVPHFQMPVKPERRLSRGGIESRNAGTLRRACRAQRSL